MSYWWAQSAPRRLIHRVQSRVLCTEMIAASRRLPLDLSRGVPVGRSSLAWIPDRGLEV
jgi:hypothetical protein